MLKNFDAILKCILQFGESESFKESEILCSVADLYSWFMKRYGYEIPESTLAEITVENFDEYLHCFPKECVKEYKKMRRYIDKGYVLVSKMVDYNDVTIQNILDAAEDGENIVIVMKE